MTFPKSTQDHFSKSISTYLIVACVLFFFAPITLYISIFKFSYISDDTTKWGAFGDYISGVTGSIFSLISVILLFYTFKDQRDNLKREKFENQFYELLRFHKDNVAELILGQDQGKKIFVIFLREFRAALETVKRISVKHQISIERVHMLEIAYLILYYGTGPNSTRILINSMPEYTNEFLTDMAQTLSRDKKRVKIKRNFSFTPFEGHQSRLAHYYRHLYQTIAFVDSNTFLSIEEKKNYIKMVRAQLSNHEQALLFFNSLSRLGKSWSKEGLITRYSLIKNLPKSFIDETKEVDVKTIYKEITFEWEEAFESPLVDKHL